MSQTILKRPEMLDKSFHLHSFEVSFNIERLYTGGTGIRVVHRRFITPISWARVSKQKRIVSRCGFVAVRLTLLANPQGPVYALNQLNMSHMSLPSSL